MMMRPSILPKLSSLLSLVFACFFFCFLQPVSAWGITGHQIVATIAQTQLHPAVRELLCSILPEFTQYPSAWPVSSDDQPNTHCHLAPLAGWPDTIRYQYPWSGQLHYVNPTDDDPPHHCGFSDSGWTSPDNVLTSLVNYTSRVITETGWERDMALRFVVHLFGDAHQPLHLTGRARGGNDVAVLFEGRRSNLHSVWDTLIIDKQIRELANYTTRFSSGRIESALTGARYDPYIRWILKEGLGQPAVRNEDPQGWWSPDADEWPSCPTLDLTQEMLAFVPDALEVPSQVDDTLLPICPYAWTKTIHPLVCRYAFAPPVPSSEADPESRQPTTPLPELDTPEYLGRIDSDKVIQKQLAQAGIRLAAVLNTIFLDPDFSVEG